MRRWATTSSKQLVWRKRRSAAYGAVEEQLKRLVKELFASEGVQGEEGEGAEEGE
jgi:hypothetical protein